MVPSYTMVPRPVDVLRNSVAHMETCRLTAVPCSWWATHSMSLRKMGAEGLSGSASPRRAYAWENGCMGLMWWLGFLAFVVRLIPFSAEDTLLRFAVVGGAIAVPVIGFLTALVGSAIQVFIRWRRRQRLPLAA